MYVSPCLIRSIAIGCILLWAGPLSVSMAEQPKVLLIGIDGVRSDALQRASTPNLDGLASNGLIDLATRVISESVTSSDTVSGPGWTTFLTGTWTDLHGVVDNSFKGRNRQAAPHAFAIAKRARPELRTASFVTWAPINEFITTNADVNASVIGPKFPDNNKKTDYAAADQLVAQFAVATLQHDPVDLAFVYFGAVDEQGHAHGFHPTVPEYVTQIERTDTFVGQLLRAVEQRATFADEDWLYVVSTDHGGEGTGHGGGRDNPSIRMAPMIVSGKQVLSGDEFARRSHATTDVIAVAMAHLGIEDGTSHLAGDAGGWLQP